MSKGASSKPPNHHIQALEELTEKIAATTVMAQMYIELQDYPLRLMRQLITEYKRRQTSVPDHSLDLSPLLGETALRSLVESGLAERVDDSPYAIHTYIPTTEGIRLGSSLLGT